MIKDVLKEFFMVSFCLANDADNILLWSHYADGHEGYCLQFDKKPFENHTTIWPLEVGYDAHNKFPPYREFVEVLDKGGEELAKHVLGVKAKEWEYENEYRAFICKEENKKIYIKSLIKRQNSPITIYQAFKKDNEYGIRLEEVSTD